MAELNGQSGPQQTNYLWRCFPPNHKLAGSQKNNRLNSLRYINGRSKNELENSKDRLCTWLRCFPCRCNDKRKEWQRAMQADLGNDSWHHEASADGTKNRWKQKIRDESVTFLKLTHGANINAFSPSSPPHVWSFTGNLLIISSD